MLMSSRANVLWKALWLIQQTVVYAAGTFKERAAP